MYRGSLTAHTQLGWKSDRSYLADRRSLGFLAQPVASFAVLPLLGTLLAKAQGAIKNVSIKLITSCMFSLETK